MSSSFSSSALNKLGEVSEMPIAALLANWGWRAGCTLLLRGVLLTAVATVI